MLNMYKSRNASLGFLAGGVLAELGVQPGYLGTYRPIGTWKLSLFWWWEWGHLSTAGEATTKIDSYQAKKSVEKPHGEQNFETNDSGSWYLTCTIRATISIGVSSKQHVHRRT